MAFKMKGMTFGKGTGYKSPQLMAKEAAAKAAKKAARSPKDMKHGSPKDMYGSPKDMYGSPKEMYGSPKDMYGSPKDMDHSPQKFVVGLGKLAKGAKVLKDKAGKIVTNVKKKFSKSSSVDEAAKKAANTKNLAKDAIVVDSTNNLIQLFVEELKVLNTYLFQVH